MGCDIYHMTTRLGRGTFGPHWGDLNITFSAADDDMPCLCTLASNYKLSGGVDVGTVRSMAYLGAMVALAHGGAIKPNDGGYAYLPYDLPLQVREVIDRFLPDDAQNAADAMLGVE